MTQNAAFLLLASNRYEDEIKYRRGFRNRWRREPSTGPMSQGLPQVFDISQNCGIAFFEVSEQTSLCSQQGEGEGIFDTPTESAKIAVDLEVKKWGAPRE